MQPEIHRLYISPGHNFFGHHGREPDTFPAIEVSTLDCVTNRGIRDDRFFDYKENYRETGDLAETSGHCHPR